MKLSTDKLQEKWERITPRERGLILVLGVTFVLILLSSVAMLIGDGLDAIEKRNADMRKALKTMERLRNADPSDTPEQIQFSDKPIKLESYLESIATQVEITIPGYDPRAPATHGNFIESSTSIDMKGITLSQLAAFLEKVERTSNVVIVSELNIKRNFREAEMVDAEMVVTTYSKVAKSEEKDDADGTKKSSESGKNGAKKSDEKK